jgi:hypothetical protein
MSGTSGYDRLATSKPPFYFYSKTGSYKIKLAGQFGENAKYGITEFGN